jgi:hypothetical protein
MIHQIADENGTLKHIILSVMDTDKGSSMDSNIIDFPHSSFRVDSLGELVSTVDGQMYGYPACCCCCYCDPDEAAAAAAAAATVGGGGGQQAPSMTADSMIVQQQQQQQQQQDVIMMTVMQHDIGSIGRRSSGRNSTSNVSAYQHHHHQVPMMQSSLPQTGPQQPQHMGPHQTPYHSMSPLMTHNKEFGRNKVHHGNKGPRSQNSYKQHSKMNHHHERNNHHSSGGDQNNHHNSYNNHAPTYNSVASGGGRSSTNNVSAYQQHHNHQGALMHSNLPAGAQQHQQLDTAQPQAGSQLQAQQPSRRSMSPMVVHNKEFNRGKPHLSGSKGSRGGLNPYKQHGKMNHHLDRNDHNDSGDHNSHHNNQHNNVGEQNHQSKNGREQNYPIDGGDHRPPPKQQHQQQQHQQQQHQQQQQQRQQEQLRQHDLQLPQQQQQQQEPQQQQQPQQQLQPQKQQQPQQQPQKQQQQKQQKHQRQNQNSTVPVSKKDAPVVSEASATSTVAPTSQEHVAPSQGDIDNKHQASLLIEPSPNDPASNNQTPSSNSTASGGGRNSTNNVSSHQQHHNHSNTSVQSSLPAGTSPPPPQPPQPPQQLPPPPSSSPPPPQQQQLDPAQPQAGSQPQSLQQQVQPPPRRSMSPTVSHNKEFNRGKTHLSGGKGPKGGSNAHKQHGKTNHHLDRSDHNDSGDLNGRQNHQHNNNVGEQNHHSKNGREQQNHSVEGNDHKSHKQQQQQQQRQRQSTTVTGCKKDGSAAPSAASMASGNQEHLAPSHVSPVNARNCSPPNRGQHLNHNQNNHHHHHHGTNQSIKITNLLKQCRNKFATNMAKLVQNSLSGYSDTKFAGLLLIIFTMFATLLAIFIHYYIIAPVNGS